MTFTYRYKPKIKYYRYRMSYVLKNRKVLSSRQMKEVEIALEVDAVATSELNVEVPYCHGVPVNSVADP